MKTKTWLAATLTVPTLAFGGVNPPNGDFYMTYEDIALKSDGHELVLSRTYNSLATETGWFGFGWGTRYETRLIVMPDGSAVVKENGTGQLSHYRPKTGSELTGGVARIVDAAVRQDKLAPGAADDLRGKLAGNEVLRVRSVQKYDVRTELPAGAELKGDECDAERLARISSGYTRMTCKRSVDEFDMQGRLVRHRERDGYEVSLAYDGARPTTIADSLGQTMTLKWTPAGHVAVAASGGDHHLIYRYNDRHELIKSNDVNGNAYRYEYDDNHNLTRIGYVDDSRMRIEYVSADSGRVSAVTDRFGDRTVYAYRSDPNDSQHTWTKITRISASGQVHTREYEFQRQMTVAGEEQMTHVAASQGHRQEALTYDSKGRVVRRVDTAGGVTEFIYHPKSDKLIVVSGVDLQTVFRYNDAGELTSAENSDGQLIELDYGNTDYIQRMVETNRNAPVRRELTFKYDAAGRPVQIRLIGTGTIDVTYDEKGEIRKVSSNDGPKMALQVTQAMQTLLRVVRVAGVRFAI